MARSIWVRILVGLSVASLLLAGLVLTAPNVQGATWSQDTDADFALGTLSGTEIIGTGPAATVQLLRDATDWVNENPASNPGGREGSAMAYDAANGVVVLFGGYNGANLGDTWEYDPVAGSWSQSSSTGPSPRAFAGLAYDSANARVVLFGGFSDSGFEADTWEYNAATDTWEDTTPTPPDLSPPFMSSYHLVDVSSRQRTLLIGLNALANLMETWAYDAAADAWEDRNPTAQPSTRSSFALAYHADLDRVVFYGGVDPNPPPGQVLGDTWEYDWGTNLWTLTVADGSGPPARTGHGMTYRDSASTVFLFGGQSSTGTPLADTWRYFDVGGTRVWASYSTQRSPAARYSFAIADESANAKSIVFGGVISGGGRPSDTWGFQPVYRTTGFFTSQRFDSGGANANWNTISWTPTAQPAGGTLRFQIATSNSPTGPWNYLGPNCASNTYYTTSGTATCTSQDDARYLQFQANLFTTDNLNSAIMDSVTIDYTVPVSAPFIVFTDPPNAPPPVLQTVPIFVRFSEAMDTGSVTWTIDPPTSVTPSWSEGDSALTLDHTTPLQECRLYRVEITGGTDQAGTPIDNGLNRVSNPWFFATQCINPTITATDPVQGQNDVPLNADIIVDFSEEMDTASVSWTISPNIALTPVWSNGNTRLNLSHTTDFPQCEMHTVTISGNDLAGLPLAPGPIPNPFEFTTVCTIPFIVTTNPTDFQIDVAGTADVIVTFSEPMQPSSVTWDVTPVTTLTPAWSNGDRTLTLSHSTAWADCTIVTMHITGGKDLDGNDLFPGQHPGHAANPWKFAVTCPNPFLVVTVPQDGDTNVDPLADIIIQFSEVMNIASVSWSITPSIILAPNWNAQEDVLRLFHTDPFPCGVNTVSVSGEDLSGNPLVAGLVPNPWSFTPSCPNPYIVSTDPADGATNVLLTAPIVVTFSEPINPTTLLWDISPLIPLTPTWSAGDTVVTFNHGIPFDQSTQYIVAIISAMDVDGNDLIGGPVPNPWSFTTAGVNPFILSTDPADGATGVPVLADVIVVFSEAMNPGTVVVTPTPPIALFPVWSNGDTRLMLTHTDPFVDCVQYVFEVMGNDAQGDPLGPGPVPNPWRFTIECFAPYIVDTNPADGEIDVPVDASIWINFSEPMNTANVNVLLAPPLSLTSTWSSGDQTLMVSHVPDFAPCQQYTVTVSGTDLDGNPLTVGPVPNPWSFTTVCPPPVILSTDPPDGATNVPTTAIVTVTFSRPMDTATVTWTFTPGATVSSAWSGGNTVLTLVPNPPLLECTLYTVEIQGRSVDGKDLVPGPVPNPWSFSTVCVPVNSPGGLQVSRVAPISIRLSWNAVAGADSYRVYESQNRFASWPWTVLGTTATTTFDAAGHLTDGLTHYYVVRALRGATESGNSTMGVKIDRSFGFGTTTTNVHWFSLPYRSQYARASDITNELTNAKIDVVAKWNPATQSPILYYWFRGAWRGTDFTISTGDGLYVGAVSAFSWVLVGTDRAVTLSFTRNNPPLGNVNWVSLPYTGTYQRASDLVLDIEGSLGAGANTKIVEVVKWDSATQTTIRFFWQPGGWTGTDFALAPGDAVYFTIVANFSWQPRLVTPEVP